MRVTPAMLTEWLECPRRFQFRHVEGEVRPPLLRPVWENAVLRGLIACMKVKEEEDRLLSLDEMVRVVMEGYTSKLDLLEKPPRKGKMDSYFAHATTICQEFLHRDMAIITPTQVSTLHIAQISTDKQGVSHELMAPVHVIDGNQIGMIAVNQYKMRKDIALASPFLVCAVMATGIDHYWFLTVSVRKGADFTKHHGYLPDGIKRWYEHIIKEAAPMMENGPYPPCFPGVWYCCRAHCQYWGSCRGLYQLKERVIRS